MSDLPTDLDTLLEAVEAMMGSEFADMLEREVEQEVLDAQAWAIY